jgi:death-on-curing protein
MNEPCWITTQECLALHRALIARFGGCDGIRDDGLMESALSRPLQLFNYASPTVSELAAAYAEGIVKNHPFLDGNKRTGFVLAALFLESNGYSFTAPEEEAVLQNLALAAGAIGAEEYAEWLSTSIGAVCEKV